MSEPVAFKTTDPSVIAWWEESVAAKEKFRAEVEAWEAEYGMGRRAVVMQGWNISVHGLEVLPSDREDGPPEGWRIVDGKHASWIQPYRRSKAQKAIHEAMPRMAESRDSMPGFDWSFLGGLPGFALHDGIAYCNIGSKDADRIDTAIWEPIPLSEFYAAKEAAKAAA